LVLAPKLLLIVKLVAAAMAETLLKYTNTRSTLASLTALASNTPLSILLSVTALISTYAEIVFPQLPRPAMMA
jgi:hypothetical protein